MKNIFIMALIFPVYIWSIDSYTLNTPTKKDIIYFVIQKSQTPVLAIVSHSDKNIKEDKKMDLCFKFIGR